MRSLPSIPIICMVITIISAGWAVHVTKEAERRGDALESRIKEAEALSESHFEMILKLTESSGRYSELEKEFDGMLEREGARQYEESTQHILTLAKDHAGTEKEAWAKDRAMWHAEQAAARGGLPGAMTKEKLVNGFFDAVKRQAK